MNIEFETLGENKVVISRDDFENLLDVVAFDEAKARNEEFFPIELVERMINGESPVKVFREYRGFTQAQLAKRTGVTQGMISEIEGGKKQGSVETLKKIAFALDLDIDDLV